MPMLRRSNPEPRTWRRGKGEGLQIAAVSSVRSLLRPHCFAELAAVTCGSPK